MPQHAAGVDNASDPTPPWAAPLLAAVDRAFLRTGAATPGWPDPHRGAAPRPEEYSRVTEVGKYRILDARLEAWVEVLADADVATTADVAARAWPGARRPPEHYARVRLVEPVAQGGLSLLAGNNLVDGEPFGLDLGIASDREGLVFLAGLPGCGCDACDDGSDALLDEMDGWMLTVARGGVVHARRGDDWATRIGSGSERANRGSLAWLDEAIAAPDGVRRWTGAPWLNGTATGERGG